MADKYKSTMLASSNDQLEIQKADLDLLKKINEVAESVGSAYTVGSIYTQFAGTSTPAELFSGTWKDISSSYPQFTKGGIYDSGSNINGSWIKFADGTMSCYKVVRNYAVAANATTDLNYTLPVNFIGDWIGSGTCQPLATWTGVTAFIGANLSTGTTWYVHFTNGATAQSFNIEMFAHGRWSSTSQDPSTIWQKTGDATTVNAATNILQTQKGNIVNSYSETDSVTRTFSTTVADGKIWSNNPYNGNSKLFVNLHIPMRNDSASRGGGYTDLLYQINNSGTWISLGNSGYDGPMCLGTDIIPSVNYQFLIPIGPGKQYIQFKCQHRSYDGTLTVNGSHDIVGEEFFSKLIVLEIANDAQTIDPLYGAYYRPAIYRYYTSDNVATRYVHLKTNQPMNNIMFAYQFQGYEFGALKPIDAMVVGYPYGPSNDVINKGTSGTHTCGAYKSADGYTVLTILLASTYFVGFIVNQIGAGPQGLFPTIITASTYSASATGVY